MKKDVQFSGPALMPVGQGFYEMDDLQKLDDEEAIKEINQAKTNFQQSAKTKGAKLEGRKSRDEKPFISKIKFILTHRDFARLSDPQDVLISLLADSSTLFSRSYQAYEMNRKFYRSLRLQHGKTEKDELQYCKNCALRNIKENGQKKLYEYILNRLEEKAAHEGRQVADLEYQLVCIVVNKNMHLVIRTENAFSGDQEHFNNILQSDALNQIIDEAWVYGLAAEQLCAVLQRWFPDSQLVPQKVFNFPSGVLRDYFSCIKRIPLEKKAAGHHTPVYKKIDTVNCQEYLRKRDRLRELAHQHKMWERYDYKQVFREGYTYDYLAQGVKITARSKQIADSLEAFLGKRCELSENLEHMVMCAETAEHTDKAIFPFHYLMLAVTDQKRLFSQPDFLGTGRVLRTCSSPYSRQIPRQEQRIKRIRFLNELNFACGLDRADRSKNWGLFLNVHGTRIESKEEFELWQKILYSESSEKTNEDIPVIELTLLCLDCLGSCLPDRMETLYCYRSGSLMHRGGFAKFIGQYSDVLDACINRIKQKGRAEYAQKYLQEWGKLECDQTAIRNLCKECANKIRWGSISPNLNKKLADFCQAVCTEEQVVSASPKMIIKDNVQELKNLLVEAAFRKILAEDAAAILTEQAEHLLNMNANYKMFLKELLWL